MIQPALAQSSHTGGGTVVITPGTFVPAPASTYTGPGDIQTLTAFYSFRAYSSTTTGRKAVNIRNTSTNETCDFTTTASGGLNTASNCSASSNGAALSTFCGTCAVTKAYDQTQGNACAGATCDIAQATAANQPGLSVSCQHSLPCWQFTTTTMKLASANSLTPASGTVSYTAVTVRNTGGANQIIAENGVGNRWTGSGNNNQTRLVGGSSGAFNVTASDNTFHSMIAVMNGASSVVNVDGTETSGTATGSTTAGAPTSGATSADSQYVSETSLVDNVAISSGNRTSLHNNMCAYWGTTC